MLRRTSTRFLVLVFLLALVGIIGMSTMLTLAQAQTASQAQPQAPTQAQSQAPTQAQTPPVGADQQTVQEEPDTDTDEQADQQPDPALDADAAIAAGGQAGEDEEELADGQLGGRFIPTEQISQDLGVSFPVDI